MKTRKRKSKSEKKHDEHIPISGDKGDEICICNIAGSFPIDVKFYDLPTPEMVVIDDTASLNWIGAYRSIHDRDRESELFGKFVKVSPILKASEAHLFNASEIRKEIERCGAKAVVIAPRIVSDSRKIEKEVEVESRSVHELVEAWFSEQKISEEEKEEAIQLTLKFMSEEGV